MGKLKQENHLHSIETPFGKDVLVLDKCTGSESLSDLYSFDLSMVSETEALDPKKIIGKPVGITVNLEDGNKRYFHGRIVEFQSGGTIRSGEFHRYYATLVPELWFTQKTQDCKIFQDKSFKEIIEYVLGKYGISYKFDLTGSYAKHDYCVQFNESDYTFICRLMQEEGLVFYFEHKKSSHQLIITDDVSTFKECEEGAVHFSQGNENDAVVGVRGKYKFSTGTHFTKNFDFKAPNNIPSGFEKVAKPLFPDVLNHEIYNYPGEGLTAADLKKESKIKTQAYNKENYIVDGASGNYSISPGKKFKITDSALKQHKNQLLQIVNCRYILIDETHLNQGSAERKFHTLFETAEAGTPYRAGNLIKKPQVPGVQSAIVTGPKDQEIYVDEFGRVKVQFHWDRDGKYDEKSSCWLRVSQAWAGKSWGTFFHPRIGDEVLVDFIDGDLDKPIVVGRVYNGKNKTYYSLPENKTKSGIKTQSTLKGSNTNFNEFTFEDKKGEERIYIHAEKNMDTEVENDQTLTVDHNRDKVVKNDQSENIGNDKSIEVKRHHTEGVGGNMSISVDKNLIEKVKVDYTEDVDQNKKSTIGKNLDEDIGANHTENVKDDYILNAKRIQMTARDEISIKVGSASILMKKNGDITIQGKTINIKGSGDVILKGKNIKEN
ncbi:type VI secretion system Vgr family protein [Aliikangiella maris]|uniref:Type VI secretion system tip protein TssI/VgrG n=2 Tax=Aliikangiella maris TaxID=3162458 RepID=A0ABV2BSL9_9GAMM